MRGFAGFFTAAAVFVVAALLLILISAFCLRLALGASTYRSSGAWVGVIIGSVAAAAALSALAFRGVSRPDR